WQTCSRCAGAGGSGPATVHSLTQHISSPSLDGSSAKFSVGGSTAWANAYWWKQLSGTSAGNFIYDVYFYLKTPSAAHALEFDLNQLVNSKHYIFGTECVQGSGWKVYDAYNHVWRSTSISCSSIKAYTWNHLILEFQRVNGKQGFV